MPHWWCQCVCYSELTSQVRRQWVVCWFAVNCQVFVLWILTEHFCCWVKTFFKIFQEKERQIYIRFDHYLFLNVCNRMENGFPAPSGQRNFLTHCWNKRTRKVFTRLQQCCFVCLSLWPQSYKVMVNGCIDMSACVSVYMCELTHTCIKAVSGGVVLCPA